MSSETETTETPADAPETPEIKTGTPVEVADIEEAELIASDPVAAANATRFFFAHVGVLREPDNSILYHVKDHHALITDPVLAAKLTELSKIPSNKIFITE